MRVRSIYCQYYYYFITLAPFLIPLVIKVDEDQELQNSKNTGTVYRNQNNKNKLGIKHEKKKMTTQNKKTLSTHFIFWSLFPEERWPTSTGPKTTRATKSKVLLQTPTWHTDKYNPAICTWRMFSGVSTVFGRGAGSATSNRVFHLTLDTVSSKSCGNSHHKARLRTIHKKTTDRSEKSPWSLKLRHINSHVVFGLLKKQRFASHAR